MDVKEFDTALEAGPCSFLLKLLIGAWSQKKTLPAVKKSTDEKVLHTIYGPEATMEHAHYRLTHFEFSPLANLNGDKNSRLSKCGQTFRDGETSHFVEVATLKKHKKPADLQTSLSQRKSFWDK